MSVESCLRFIRFVGAASISLPFNVASRLLLSTVVDFDVAVVGAQLVGMLVAFMAMRRLVFDATGRSGAVELARFGLVNVIALVQMWVVSVGLLAVLPTASISIEVREMVAHLLGLGSTAITSFYLHRSFSFRPTASLDRRGRVGRAPVRGLPSRPVEVDRGP